MVKTTYLAALIPLVTFASACDFVPANPPLTDEYNDFSYNIGDVVTNGNLCATQGAGSYTFGMMVQEGSLGLPGSTTAGSSFAVMDNTCKLLGVYNIDQTNCGIPFVLEANYLKYVLTLTQVFTDVGKPSFTFTYANGQYQTDVNQCGCGTISNNGNGAVAGCKCAFPVAGEPSKREVTVKSAKFRA